MSFVFEGSSIRLELSPQTRGGPARDGHGARVARRVDGIRE